MPLKQEPSPRFKLKALSKQLRKLSFPTSPVTISLARFAADAFDKYLTGSCSLETAFGLGKKKGAPGRPKARLKLAKAVHALRKAGHSWNSVLNKLPKEGLRDRDSGNVQRTYDEFKFRLIAHDLTLTLDQDDDRFASPKIRKPQPPI